MPHHASQTKGGIHRSLKHASSVSAKGVEQPLTRPNGPTSADVHGEIRSTSLASSPTAISSEDQRINVVSTSSPLKRRKEEGNNIKVIVRCRGPSQAELRVGSPIIATTDGPRSEELVVIPNRTSNPNTHSPQRAYQFDQVFGADADQSIIYQDVVVPILNEVFDGYNATLCAYGQTGTGKTYTMHGELERQSSGALDRNAGIAPRVITRLFQRLERDYTDFTVSISYMELYNEELRDLLAPLDGGVPLKVFDEPSKRGTVVQGLLELYVKDVQSAIDILRLGNERRQVAATKLNDRSSRSHAIFTVSVTSVKGSKDMFQIGKLNLVDLAGSEDIGRSGAENGRAKEAGLINRSLLAFGRVINALVDRVDGKTPSSHIPYRESILTRVLQDSLGGHTKTCIIATVSPVQANLEETLSTLDYATRARSIKNNPEATRRVAKHTLLKEMVAEMDRLRADLTATREKNGRYFHEERWSEIEAEQENLIREHAESRRAREIVEAQLLTLREEYEYNMLLLKRKDTELSETKERLGRTSNELEVAVTDLIASKAELQEEIAVRQEFESNGVSLDKVATGLRSVARQGISDLQRLFEKLDRKSGTFAANVNEVHAHASHMSESVQVLGTIVDQHRQQQQSFIDKLRDRVESFKGVQSEVLNKELTALDENINSLTQRSERIIMKERASAELAVALAQIISDTNVSIRGRFESWKVDLVENHDHFMIDLRDTLVDQVHDVTKTTQTLASLLEGIVHDVDSHVERDRRNIIYLKELTESAVVSEVARLQNQDSELARFAKSEQLVAETMRNEIIQHVTKLMDKYTDARSNTLRETISTLSTNISHSQREVEEFKRKHANGLGSYLAGDTELLGQMEKTAADYRQAQEITTRTLNKLPSSVDNAAQQARTRITLAMEEHARTLGQDTEVLGAAASGTFERLEKSRLLRLEELTAIRDDSIRTQQHTKESVSTTSNAFHDARREITEACNSLGDVAQGFHDTVRETTTNLREVTRSLSRRAAVQDISTGMTPQKRKWDYDDEWAVVNDRAAALKRWREKQSSDTRRALSPHETASAGPSSTVNEEAEGQDSDNHGLNVGSHVEVDLDDDGARSSERAISLRQKSTLTSLLPPESTIPMRPSASGQPQLVTSRSWRKANAPSRVGAAATRKTSSAARTSKCAIGGSRLPSNGAIPQVSNALTEYSNTTRRKRDKM